MKISSTRKFIPVLIILAAFFPNYSFALPILTNKDAANEARQLSQSGFKVVACPRYATKPSTGLYTSLNSANTICILGATTKNAQKSLAAAAKKILTLDGRLKGSVFTPVSGNNFDPAQADINTNPFTEVNYPVAIFFDVDHAQSQADYDFSIMDPADDPASMVTDVVHGPVWNSPLFVDFIGAGTFYAKISATTDKKGDQPLFFANMSFMPQYSGIPVTAKKARAKLKVLPCPAYLYDFWGKQIYTTPGLVCSNVDPASSGFTAAPFNLKTGLFLTRTVSPNDGLGGPTQGFPFRLLKSTSVFYSIFDPAPVKTPGHTTIYLVNLSSGVRTLFAQIEGSTIGPGTTSFENTSGDFYFDVVTSPFERATYGEIRYAISVQGSD